MRLYVLGPAFGLPSIDAECAAAIALLQWHQPGDWRIIPTHDNSLKLPLLVDAAEELAGFRSIARHLQIKTASPDRPTADAIAIASFIESNAQTLLDISLYVSYENYSNTTRPTFTKILPWHTNYTLPPSLRAAARARAEHLGISSIDVDNVHEDMSNRPEGWDGVGKEKSGGGFEAESQKRASLLLPRKETVRSLLQRPEHSAVFKLHALADNFFAPLQEMLGDREYLVGEEMSGVDCLACAYLSLMLFPTVPQDWLASTMRRKYKKLVAYTERMHQKLDLQTKAEDVVSLSKCASVEDVIGRRKACNLSLPWNPPAAPTVIGVSRRTAQELLSQIPLFSRTATIVSTNAPRSSFWQTYLPTILGVTATSIGLSLYYAFRTGALIWPHGEEVHIFGRKRFADYGHLGAALSGLSFIGQQASADAAFHAQEQADNPVHVEVAVEGDNMP